MNRAIYLLVFGLAVVGGPAANAEDGTVSDEQLMATLKGAAPADIVEHATILNKDANGEMKPIQEGTNGWTCLDPGGEPLCADKVAWEWIGAWQSKKPAPTTPGFIYMLKGDHGASNTDPYAKGKTDDNYWVQTGPHVMIVSPPEDMVKGYPTDNKGDPTKPYVMWAGTPYQHLMLPLQ